MGTARSIRLKEHDPVTEHTLIPQGDLVANSDETLQEGPFTLRTCENGFIITGNQIEEDSTPIAIIGDSFVESSWVHEDIRFVSQAERLMPGYRLLNGGYSGATTLQLYNVMLNKIYPVVGNRGTIVFFVGMSDGDIVNRHASYWTHERLWSPIIPAPEGERDLPTGISQVEIILDFVVHTAQKLGLTLILGISPYRDGNFNDDPVLRGKFKRNRTAFELRTQEQKDIQQVTRETAHTNDIPLIDGQALTGGNPDSFYDALHLNECGQTEFSRLFAADLQQHLNSDND